MIYIRFTDRWFWRRSSRKKTRIARNSFRRRADELMMGKLVSVGLAGLTQLGISDNFIQFWSSAWRRWRGGNKTSRFPNISPWWSFRFSYIFFFWGFSSTRFDFPSVRGHNRYGKAGSFRFRPKINLAQVGFYYFSFAVIQDPNSQLSFWVFHRAVLRADYDASQNSQRKRLTWQIAFLLTRSNRGLIWRRAFTTSECWWHGRQATLPGSLEWIWQN